VSATAFDEVRYLGREGTQQQFRQVAALERDLRAARPELDNTALDTVTR
jgi:hypothetical protein